LEARGRVLVGSLSIPLCLLAMWALVGLPPPLPQFLLLDRVEVARAVMGIGVSSVILLAVLLAAEYRRPGSRAAHPAYWVAAAVTVLVYGAAGLVLRHQYEHLGLTTWSVVIASILASSVLVVAGTGRVLVAGVLYAGLGLILALGSNPLFQGLGILDSSSVLGAVDRVVGHGVSGGPEWISFGATPQVTDTLTAAGVPYLGSVSLYPVTARWQELDPRGRSFASWDRYATVYFDPGPPGSAPRISLSQTDLVVVTVDPCGVALARLGVGFFVSQRPLEGSCLTLERSLSFEHLDLRIYRRAAASGD
jgi:hypothetical protein